MSENKMKLDIEKIRQGVCQCLLDCDDDAYETQCYDCPYYSEGITVSECKRNLRNDFITMLKEHEDEIRKLASLCQNVDVNALFGRKVI